MPTQPNGSGVTTLGRSTLLLASGLTVMAGAAVAPALVSISDHFIDEGGEPGRVTLLSKLILTLPGLFIAILAPVSGYVLDRVGRRPILLVSLVLYALAGTSGLWLPNLPAILVGRAFLGIATAGVMTAATTLIGDYFQGQERARFMGLQSSFMAAGGIVFLPGQRRARDDRLALAVRRVRHLADHRADGLRRHSRRADATSGHGRSSCEGLAGSDVAHRVWLCPVRHGVVLLHADAGAVPRREDGLRQQAAPVGRHRNQHRRQHRRRPDVRARPWATEFPAVFAAAFGVWTIGYGLTAVTPGLPAGLIVLFVAMFISGVGGGWLMPNCSNWLLSETPEHLRGRLVGGLTASFFAGQFVSPLLAAPFVSRGGESMVFAAGAVASLVVSGAFAVLAKRPITPTASP